MQLVSQSKLGFVSMGDSGLGSIWIARMAAVVMLTMFQQSRLRT